MKTTSKYRSHCEITWKYEQGLHVIIAYRLSEQTTVLLFHIRNTALRSEWVRKAFWSQKKWYGKQMVGATNPIDIWKIIFILRCKSHMTTFVLSITQAHSADIYYTYIHYTGYDQEQLMQQDKVLTLFISPFLIEGQRQKQWTERASTTWLHQSPSP